jgi:hypothetical protein
MSTSNTAKIKLMVRFIYNPGIDRSTIVQAGKTSRTRIYACHGSVN